MTTRIESIDPRDGSVRGQVEAADASAVAAALERARGAQVEWARLRPRERAAILGKVRKRFLAAADDLVAVLSEENGRPAGESWLSEVVPLGDAFLWWMKHGPQLLKRERVSLNPVNFPKKTAFIEYLPRGVVGMITPWNLPVLISVRDFLPALVAGNAILHKPSEHAARTGALVGDLFGAELPDGLLEVVQGAGETGAAVVESGVDLVCFTGSVRTGKKVAAACAARLVPYSLELGGKDAAIVCADADLDRAAEGIVWAAMFNAGQNCAAIERVYVEKPVADAFIEKVVARARTLRLGEDVGPLTTGFQLETVEKQVAAAKAGGATVAVGGERPEREGNWFQPTVLTNVGDDLEVMVDETFGPVLPIRVVEDVDEAVRLANASRYGLTGSVWTRDVYRGWEIGNRLETGVLTVNNHSFTGSIVALPWTGVKESGGGMSNSRHSLEEFVRPRAVLLDRYGARQELWWYPYNETLVEIARALKDVALGKVAAFARVVGNLPKRFK